MTFPKPAATPSLLGAEARRVIRARVAMNWLYMQVLGAEPIATERLLTNTLMGTRLGRMITGIDLLGDPSFVRARYVLA